MRYKVEVSSSFYVSLAATLLLVPLKWLLAWIVAVVVHECFHLLALRIFQCQIYRLKLSLFGAMIETEETSHLAAIVCAAAGPLGSLSLLLLAHWLPAVSICGFVQGFYNLLPLYPMDGGRITKQLLTSVLSARWTTRVDYVLRYSIYALLICGGIVFLRSSLSLLPLLAAAVIIWKDRKNTLQKLPSTSTIGLPDTNEVVI